jgi:hypothetical protein
MNRFGPDGDLSNIGATVASFPSGADVPTEIREVTEVVPATDVRVGDGMWHEVQSGGREVVFSSGRTIDKIQPLTLNGQPGRRIFYGPWADDVYDNQQVRITKRTLLNDEG